MAKVDVPCTVNNHSSKWSWRVVSSLRTLWTCGLLECWRTETVPVTLTRSTYLENFLKFTPRFTWHLSFLYDFRSINERSCVENNFCMNKPVDLDHTTYTCILCSGGYIAWSSVVIWEITDCKWKVHGAKCMYVHMLKIMASENKWWEKTFVAFLFRVSLFLKRKTPVTLNWVFK